MNKKLDDDALSRWLDGELDAERSSDIEASVTADPGLSATAERLRAQDEDLRGWFDEQAGLPSPKIEQSVREAFVDRRTRSSAPGSRHWWLPAAAAAAVVIVGLAGFDYLIERRVDAALGQLRAERASDLALIASAVQEVLETRESGAEVSFSNDETGLSVTLSPQRTWKSASGHWCREFIEVFDGRSIETAPIGTACRTQEGLWMRVATEIPGMQPVFLPDRDRDL